MADPSSGPSAFVLASGKPAVGRIFRLIYTPTSEVSFEDAYGKSYANQTLTQCNFPVPADVSPDATANWLFQFEVWFPQVILYPRDPSRGPETPPVLTDAAPATSADPPSTPNGRGQTTRSRGGHRCAIHLCAEAYVEAETRRYVAGRLALVANSMPCQLADVPGPRPSASSSRPRHPPTRSPRRVSSSPGVFRKPYFSHPRSRGATWASTSPRQSTSTRPLSPSPTHYLMRVYTIGRKHRYNLCRLMA